LAGVLDATPDRLSVTVKGTETFWLNQPAVAFGPGVGTAGVPKTTPGGVRSSWTLTLRVVVWPAALVALQVKVVLAVSLVSVVGSQPVVVLMLEVGSVTVQVMVVGAFSQP
jgi:hypothetical protein